MMWRYFVFFVVLCSSGVLCIKETANVGASTSRSGGCKRALQKLINEDVAEDTFLHRLPSNGTDVCNGGSCCVSSMNDALLAGGRHHLTVAVQRSAAVLHSNIASSRDAFYQSVEQALKTTEHRLIRELKKSLPQLALPGKEVVRNLFISIKSSLLDTEEGVLENAFGMFWDDLFPIVYHDAVHQRLSPFSNSYTDCLRQARREVKPFGSLPNLIGPPLMQGLETARVMFHALTVGADIVAKAHNFEVPEECGEPAARMYFCGACHGALDPPCSGLCLNVARGCLAPLAEVDGAWTDLAGAVSRIEESLKQVRIAYHLHGLPDRILEAILYSMENGPKLQKKVRRECGEPTSRETSVPHSINHVHSSHHALDDELPLSEGVGRKVLDDASAAVEALQKSTGWWSGLADELCRDLSSDDENYCWNGAMIAPYHRTPAGRGISGQKYNPEVRVARPDTAVYSYDNTLRDVKRLVMSRLTWLPEVESLVMERGSGGSYPGPDDEDNPDNQYSGSGEGEVITSKVADMPQSEAGKISGARSIIGMTPITLGLFVGLLYIV